MKRLLPLIALLACTPSNPRHVSVAGLKHHLAEPMQQPAAAVDLDPSPEVLRIVLRAQNNEDNPGFHYAYNGQVPGPTIDAELGQILEVELINELDTGTTIHWHGLHVPYDMDGVPWQRGPVAAGERYTYRFELQQSGTFWYHPHFNTEGQVDGGLYGALIVRDPADESADLDVVALIDDRNEARADPSAPVGPAHGHGRLQHSWLVNGHSPGFLSPAAGSRIRLRMINVSNHSYLKLNGDSLRLIATDQGPLQIARSGQDEVLAPGDRAELEWSTDGTPLRLSSLPYSLNGGDALGDPAPLLDLLPTGSGQQQPPLRLNSVARLQHPDPGYADIVWSFAGSDRTGRWFINGRQFPDINIEQVALDSTVIIEVRNLSPTEHPFHLHGHTFEVVSRNGRAPDVPTYEDTINLRIRDRVRLRLIANNPGDWMSHCHILPHAEDGMMTVLRID